MPRIARLISSFNKNEVRQLFKKAKLVFRHPGLVVLCAPANKEFGRVLAVASKRIGKAHKRNLIKRRLKSIFYEEKLFKNQQDCIIIIKKEGIDLSFEQLKKIMLRSLTKR